MRGFSIYLYIYIFIYIFIYIYIYIFQAVRRAVNEMFETPDTVFNNLELLVNPSSTAKKCSATEDCCRNPGGDRRPSSTVKYCSATGLLPNRQRGERPGVNGLPFSHRRKETPVFNKLQQLKTAKHFQVYMSVRSVSIQAAQSLNVFDVHVTSTVPSCTPLLAT